MNFMSILSAKNCCQPPKQHNVRHSYGVRSINQQFSFWRKTVQAPGRNGIHGFDVRQLGQRVARDEYDKDPYYHGERCGQQHLHQIGIADRNAAAQADFDEQHEDDELIDRIWNLQLATEGGNDHTTNQKAECR